MRAQTLDVPDFEALCLHVPHDAAHAVELPVREDIAVDEARGDGLAPAVLLVRDAVIQHQAAWDQQPLRRGEVARQVAQADVLEHPDAGNLVPACLPGQIPVVHQLDRDTALQAGFGNALPGEFKLAMAQRDAMGPHTMLTGRVDQQGAPAAADVQETFTGLQAQFAANVFKLGRLRAVSVSSGDWKYAQE